MSTSLGKHASKETKLAAESVESVKAAVAKHYHKEFCRGSLCHRVWYSIIHRNAIESTKVIMDAQYKTWEDQGLVGIENIGVASMLKVDLFGFLDDPQPFTSRRLPFTKRIWVKCKKAMKSRHLHDLPLHVGRDGKEGNSNPPIFVGMVCADAVSIPPANINNFKELEKEAKNLVDKMAKMECLLVHLEQVYGSEIPNVFGGIIIAGDETGKRKASFLEDLVSLINGPTGVISRLFPRLARMNRAGNLIILEHLHSEMEKDEKKG
jgi:hypothetical protein